MDVLAINSWFKRLICLITTIFWQKLNLVMISPDQEKLGCWESSLERCLGPAQHLPTSCYSMIWSWLEQTLTRSIFPLIWKVFFINKFCFFNNSQKYITLFFLLQRNGCFVKYIYHKWYCDKKVIEQTC